MDVPLSTTAAELIRIVLLPGDGVGPQVVAEAERVLRVVADHIPSLTLEISWHLFGGAAIDATGEPLPEYTVQACLGNIRPIRFPSPALFTKSPLKCDIARGVQITVVRELLGGIYYGARKEADWTGSNPSASDATEYSVEQVTRIARSAGCLAKKSSPPLRVFSVDKANVLSTSRLWGLWRTVVSRIFASEFPAVPIQYLLVDVAAMLLAARPKQINGILLSDNLFILSDEIASLPGSISVIPSASLSVAPDGQGRTFGIYEAVSACHLTSSPISCMVTGVQSSHGPSHDLASKTLVNPIGFILSVALLFRYTLTMESVARAIEQAVSKALDSKASGGFEAWTRDLGGSFTTSEVGNAVLRGLWPFNTRPTGVEGLFSFIWLEYGPSNVYSGLLPDEEIHVPVRR